MKAKLPTPTDRFAVRLASYVSRHPWWVIAMTLLLALATGSGIRRLEFSDNYRIALGPDNPELMAFEAFQNTYTKNDNILFVLQPAAGDVFSPEALEAVESLTEAAWQIPYAIRVDSVTNFQHSRADGDELRPKASKFRFKKCFCECRQQHSSRSTSDMVTLLVLGDWLALDGSSKALVPRGPSQSAARGVPRCRPCDRCPPVSG